MAASCPAVGEELSSSTRVLGGAGRPGHFIAVDEGFGGPFGRWVSRVGIIARPARPRGPVVARKRKAAKKEEPRQSLLPRLLDEKVSEVAVAPKSLQVDKGIETEFTRGVVDSREQGTQSEKPVAWTVFTQVYVTTDEQATQAWVARSEQTAQTESSRADAGVQTEVILTDAQTNWRRVYVKLRRLSFLRRVKYNVGEFLYEFVGLYKR